MELTKQRETPGCSNFDVRDMDMDQNQCSNKSELMLTIRNKTELRNSKVGDGKQILNSVVNTSENSNDTKENSNRTIGFSTKMHRDGKAVSKNSSYNNIYTSQPDFKREIAVTQQSKSQRDFNDKI